MPRTLYPFRSHPNMHTSAHTLASFGAVNYVRESNNVAASTIRPKHVLFAIIVQYIAVNLPRTRNRKYAFAHIPTHTGMPINRYWMNKSSMEIYYIYTSSYFFLHWSQLKALYHHGRHFILHNAHSRICINWIAKQFSNCCADTQYIYALNKS